MSNTKVTLSPWDSADYLTTYEDIFLYLQECLSDGDEELSTLAVKTARRAIVRLSDKEGASRNRAPVNIDAVVDTIQFLFNHGLSICPKKSAALAV